MKPELMDCVSCGEGVQIASTAVINQSQRGNRLIIGAHSEIYDHVVIRFVGGQGDIIIGKYCYLNAGCVLYSGNGITMGDYVLIAPGAKIVPSNHGFASREEPMRCQGFAESKGGVVIEDDVWVGTNAVLLDGTIVGKGSIIAAGAVVSAKVPPYEIWGGIPAKRIRQR